jgi:hypothetical protein
MVLENRLLLVDNVKLTEAFKRCCISYSRLGHDAMLICNKRPFKGTYCW